MTADARSRFTRLIATPAPGVAVSLLLALGACSSGSHSTGSMTPSTYTIGGTVSGLSAAGLVLANGSTTLAVDSGATSFTLPGTVSSGTAYTIAVQTQPSGLTCSVANGSSTVQTANVSNVVVTCSANAFTIGGSVSGLNGTGLVLQNGTDTVTIASGASTYTLPTAVAATSSYNVTVKTQPGGVNCSVANGMDTMPAHNVTNVNVTCSDQPFTLGGTVSGLTNGGLVLANGTDTVTVAANATSFTFPTGVAFSAAYAVSVQTQPAGLTCSVSSGSDNMPAANVTSVVVTCSAQSFTLGGSITGLQSSGLVLANGTDTVAVTSGSSSFTLPTAVAFQAQYAVTVHTQPTGLTCSVGSGSAAMPANNVTSVTVTCAVNSYTLGGTVSGLHGTGLVLANGTDHTSVASNATSFTMNSSVAYGANYTVGILTQPRGYTCGVTSGSDVMGGANVTSVSVTCTQNAVWAYSSDYNSNQIYQYSVDNATHKLSAVPVAQYTTGTTPVATVVNAAGTVLYTANANSNNIMWFNIDPATGNLTPPAGGGNYVNTDYTPKQIVFNADETVAYVPDFGEDRISVYTVGSNGALTEVLGSPFDVDAVNSLANTAGPISITLHPTLPLLYVLCSYSNTIHLMDIHPDHTLTLNTIVPTGSQPSKLVINAAHTFAYSATFGANGVYVYPMDSTGALGSGLLVPTSGNNPSDLTFDPTGNYLYTTNNGDAVHSVETLSVDAVTGLLTHDGDVASALYPATVLFDADTSVVYVTNNGDPTQSIMSYTQDPATGLLTLLGTSAGLTGSAQNGVAFAKP